MYFIYQVSSAMIGALLYALKAILVSLWASIYNFLQLWPPVLDAFVGLIIDLSAASFVEATLIAVFSSIGVALKLLFVGLSDTINAIIEGLNVGFNKGIVSVLDNVFSLDNLSEFSSLRGQTSKSPVTQTPAPSLDISPEVRALYHPEFEIITTPSQPRDGELLIEVNLLAKKLLLELPKNDDKLALKQFDKLRLQNLLQLQSTLNRYDNLFRKLDDIQVALCTNNDFPTELIVDESFENPCLFFKQYLDNNQWYAVPGSTNIDGKTSIIKVIESGIPHPITYENIQAPNQYENKPTRYCWHEYNNTVGISQELSQCSQKILDLVADLQTKPAATQSWTTTQAGQMYPPPPAYKKPTERTEYPSSLSFNLEFGVI